MGYIAGAYTVTAKIASGSATSIGGTENGIELVESPQWQEIRNDEFGNVPVDRVNLGMITQVRFDMIDYTALKDVLWAHFSRGQPKANVGKLATSVAIEIVATPVAGTPAATAEGAYTFYKCHIAGDFTILLSSGHRKGPLTFDLLPDSANSFKTYNVANPS